MVILEIMVGTELVAPLRNQDEVERLLDICCPYMDASVAVMVRELTTSGNTKLVKEMLQESLPRRPMLMEQVIKDFQEAVKHVEQLQDGVDHFHQVYHLREATFTSSFGIVYSAIIRD